MASDAHVIVVDGPPEACTTTRRALEQLESLWSRFIDSSDVHRLNHGAGQPLQVDPTTITLIKVMIEAWRITGGRYDPTILPALLTAGYVASIDDPNLHSTLPAATSPFGEGSPTLGQVEVGPNGFVTLPAAMAIDAGGIGKGLAADLACTQLMTHGAGGALISIGGDLAAAGDGPEVNGWRIDIEDPFNPSETLAQVMISGGGIATSSTQTRRWISNNSDHHHIIDPLADQPSHTDLAAVTVIASCGWQAEAHATALLVGGGACFHKYANCHGIEAVASTTGGTILTTAAFVKIIHPEAAARS